jgi:predicted PurR-regulated permease PerM
MRFGVIGTVFVLVAGLYFAQEVLIPFVLAMLLAFLLAPLVRGLERGRLRRIPAVLVVVAVAFGLIFLLGWVVGGQVVNVAENLPQYQDEIVKKVRQVRGGGSHLADRIGRMGREIEKATNGPTGSPAAAVLTSPTAPRVDHPAPPTGGVADPFFTVPLPPPGSPVRTLAEYLGLALGPLGTAALVIVFVVFMLLEREDLRDRMIRLVSGGHYMVTTRALNDAGKRISRYMLAQTIVNGTYGVVIAMGLWIIGLTLGRGTPFPNVLLWGLLCAVLRFIPFIGAWVAAAFPVALSLAIYPGFEVFAATACLFVLVELLSNNVMEPWLYGASTGMSTVAILASAVFWTWLWGPIGLLLATPLTVCIVVLGKHVPMFKSLDVLLGDQPALPRHVSYYQRLLAGDAEEAARVAKEHAREKGAEHVPDDVFIPALVLARRDRERAGLSGEDELFILQSTRHVIDQLTALAPASSPAPAAPAEGEARRAGGPAPPLIFGVPAHHRAEEVALDMLPMLMRPLGCNVRGVSTRALAVEIEAEIERDKPAIVFIAVLPPGGLAQARYLCMRLRKRFDALPIVVGYFGRARDFDGLLVRLRSAGASYVTTSLRQSRGQMSALLSTARPAPTVSDATPAHDASGGQPRLGRLEVN